MISNQVNFTLRSDCTPRVFKLEPISPYSSGSQNRINFIHDAQTTDGVARYNESRFSSISRPITTISISSRPPKSGLQIIFHRRQPADEIRVHLKKLLGQRLSHIECPARHTFSFGAFNVTAPWSNRASTDRDLYTLPVSISTQERKVELHASRLIIPKVSKHNVISYVHKKPSPLDTSDSTFSFVVKSPTSTHFETLTDLKCNSVSSLVSKFSEHLKTKVCIVPSDKSKNNKIPDERASSDFHRNASLNLQKAIPPFYFPLGRPTSPLECERCLKEAEQLFLSFNNGEAFLSDFGRIAKAVGIPLYWKVLLYRACGGRKKEALRFEKFADMWRNLTKTCHDMPSRFMYLMGASQQKPYLEASDWELLILDVVNSHPGLKFLKEAKEFISRYCKTVIARIYFCVNRSWSGRITLPELRRSNILSVISKLEEENDINKFVDYFSYEHFYVIYCKFWEIDTDHDLFVSKEDLSRHNQNAISRRMIDRIFSGAVSNSKNMAEGLMSYYEFVWFLIAEEDKKHPTSIEYWFRCMDLDGDGILSMYELEYFYEEQIQRMELFGFEFMQFEDVMCQMLDMIKPEEENKIKLKDLKHCKLINIFFDTFFNVEKFLEHEQKDPFTNFKDPEAAELSDWVRYASEEYENLVSEEQARNSGDEIEQKEYEESKRDANLDLGSPLLRDTLFKDPVECNNINKNSEDRDKRYPNSEAISVMNMSTF